MSKAKWVAFLSGWLIVLFLSPAAYSASGPSPAERAVAAPMDAIRVDVSDDCTTDAECQPANPVNCREYKCVPYKSIISPLKGVKPTTVGKCTEQDSPCRPICALIAYTDECVTDTDCNKVDTDNNPCTQSKCGDETYTNTCEGKTTTSTYKKCGPELPIPGKDCTPETCPTCPDCPPPPKIDCDLIGDKMKDCCVAKGGLLWFVMDKCVEHGPGGTEDCSNIAEHVENSGTFQQCCLINNGIITGDINMCNNNWTPGGGPSPTGGTTTGTPTTPAALGACQVQCKDADCSIAVDTGGQGVGWVVSYSPPPGIGPVASVVLKQVEGPAMTAEEPAPSGTNALSIKTITDPSSLPSFIVYTAKPQSSLQGEYLPKFKLTVQLNDLADHELATLTCGNDTALEAKGSGGCGCSMADHMTTREQMQAYAMMLVLFLLPGVLFRWVRTKNR